LVSLERRFAIMAALLAGISMLAIAGTSWWLINQEHAASLHSLLKKDAELQAAAVGSRLHGIADRMSELAKSNLVANTLVDSADKERFLVPYLNGIQRIHDIPVDILLTDFEGREITSSGNSSFSEQELNWLREKLTASQPASRVQLGEKGKELIAVEFIVFSHANSAEGALLYRIKFDDLVRKNNVWLMNGNDSKHLLHSPMDIAAAVNVPPIYKHLDLHLDFSVLTSPDLTVRSVDWQLLQVFFILVGGMVVTVIILGLHFGKRLTRDLRVLEFFARDVATTGFGTDRAEAADSLEVASLAQSINRMLDHLQQKHDKLSESEECFRKQSQRLAEVIWGTDTGTWEWNVQTGEAVFNERWAEIVGYTLDELAPISINTWSKLVHPDDGKRSGELLTQCFNRESKTYRYEARMRHKNGEWVWVSDYGRVVEWTEDDKPLRMSGTHQDITERKGAEERERRRSHILEMLTSDVSLSEILEFIARSMETEDPAAICSILLLDEEGKHLLHGAAPGLPDFYNQAIHGLAIGDGVGSCGTAAFTHQRVIVEDVLTHPYWSAWRELTQKANVLACWSQPFFASDGRILGTFAIYHREQCRPASEDIARIETAANFVGLAVERRRAEDSLFRQTTLLSSLLDSIPDIVFFKDRQSVYLGCNPPFAKLVGQSRNDIIGKTDYDLFDREIADSSHSYDCMVIQEDRTLHNEEEVVYPDGRRKQMDTFKAPLITPDGQVVGLLGISRDITERKQYEISLIETAEEMQKLDQAKSNFISIASHELRTPLTSIKNAIDVILRKKAGEINENQKKFLSMAERNINRLGRLLDDLLSISKIESGKILLDYSEIDIRTVMENVVQTFGSLVDEKSISLDTRIAPDLPRLYVDAFRIEQVLINLVSNAIKFTPDQGKITIDARLGEGDLLDAIEKTGQYVMISITDTGCGIAEEFQKEVFNKFYQVESPLSAIKQPGTGLGLAISTGIVELHGGIMALKSTPRSGSTFSFSLPLATSKT